MKKMFRALLALAVMVSASAQAEVIFTQLAIGDAPAINVGIEIGNNGDDPVSMIGWTIQIYDNGAGVPTRRINLSTFQSLPPKTVKVIAYTNGNDPTIRNSADAFNSLLAAVDARDLITLVDNRGNIIDSIGQRIARDGLPTVDRPADICRKSGTLIGDGVITDVFNVATGWDNCPAPIFSDLGQYQFNTAPVADDVAVNAGLNPLLIPLDAVDAESNPLTYSIVTPPTKGIALVSGDEVIYTPNPDATGTDSFTYKANDGLLDSNVATVTITFVALTARGDGLVICAIGEGNGAANTVGDKNDFITLVNLNETPVNLNDHAVQANGFFGGAIVGVGGYSLVFNQDLFIQPGQTFTLVNGDGASASELLAVLNPSFKLRKVGRPDGNDVGTFTLNEPQVVVLFEDNGAINGGIDDADTRLDVVGSTNDLQDAINNPLSTVDNTVFRRKITFSAPETNDTNPNDPYDFAANWEAVGVDNFSELTTCFGYTDGYEPLNFKEIAEIQGATPAGDAASPLAGQRVVTRGVVTSVGPLDSNGNAQGFYMTSQNRDADDNTSDGIFVYQPATESNYTAVVVGDLVEVGGKAEEEFGQTQINATTAEQGAVIKIGTGMVTPLPVTLDATTNNQDDFERYEGELVSVSVDATTTIGNATDLCVNDIFNLGRFGEIRLVVPTPSDTIMPAPYNDEATNCYVWNPTQVFAPGAVASDREMLQMENNDRAVMILDDNSSAQNVNPVPYLSTYSNGETVRIGDRVSDLTGVLAFGFDNYRLYPTTAPTFAEGNPRPSASELVDRAATDKDGFQQDLARIRVASFNVLNYFASDFTFTDPDNRGAENNEELARQQAKLIEALLDLNADVIGLIEMENLDEPTGYAIAVATLAAALNAAPGSPGTYAFVDDLSNANCALANDDAIKNGLIYRTDRVNLAGVDCVVNSAFDNARAPLIGTFAVNNTPQQFVVVVNHFKSKGSSGALGLDIDQGDGQGFYNASRTAQAQVHKAVTDPLTLPTYIIGDLNAYGNEDPVTTFTAGGYFNLVQDANPDNEVYSYTFPSNTSNIPNRATQFGTLDYALANTQGNDRAVFAAEYNINSPESRIFDYNLNFKDAPGCTNGSSCDGEDVTVTTDPYASSDHDPLLVALNFWNRLNGTGYPQNFTRPTMIYDEDNGQGLVFYAQGGGPSGGVRVIELSATDGFAGDTVPAGLGTPYAPTAVRIAGNNLVYAIRNNNPRVVAVNSYDPVTDAFSGWQNIQTASLVNALLPVDAQAIAAAPLNNGNLLLVAVTTADEAYYAELQPPFNQVNVWQALPTLNNYDRPFMAFDESTGFTILSLRNTADNDIEIFQHNGTTWVYTEQQVASNDTFTAYGMPLAYNAKKARVDVLLGNTGDNQIYYSHLIGLGVSTTPTLSGLGLLLDSDLDYLADLDKVPAIGSRPEGVTALFTSEGPGTGRIFFKNSVDGELK